MSARADGPDDTIPTPSNGADAAAGTGGGADPAGPDALARAMLARGYVGDADLAAALHLAGALGRPLLLEGEAGVGKTEVAKVLAEVLGARLIRLQCYEGLDAQHALYDWDYQRQLLAIQMARTATPEALRATLYSEPYLIRRPLLEAISGEGEAVLLIDEIDRADEEFEALLLEILSDFQVSIPELGTFVARRRPRVILTSNGVRELSDALRRRCLYHYLDYPDAARERAIVAARLPGIEPRLLAELVEVVQRLRGAALRKAPGLAETLDWAASLMRLDVVALGAAPETVERSLVALLKTREDRALVAAHGIGVLLPEGDRGDAADAAAEADGEDATAADGARAPSGRVESETAGADASPVRDPGGTDTVGATIGAEAGTGIAGDGARGASGPSGSTPDADGHGGSVRAARSGDPVAPSGSDTVAGAAGREGR